MKMHDRVRIAVAWFLMNDVDRFSVEVECQHLRECDTRTVDSQFDEPSGRWRRCPHSVSAETSERILMHGDERAATSPACVALGVSQVLRRNYDTPNGRFRATCKDGADLRCTGGRRCSDKQN